MEIVEDQIAEILRQSFDIIPPTALFDQEQRIKLKGALIARLHKFASEQYREGYAQGYNECRRIVRAAIGTTTEWSDK